MSNERFIYKYKNHVKLIQSLMKPQRADQVGRIYHNSFVLDLGSDQDFFEAINWFACIAIRVAITRSLTYSRKLDIEKVRYYNSVVVTLSELISPSWYDPETLYKMSYDLS